MTSYRYLGYGVTNSNGVAHLDHDPQGNPINGYTGTGAGEVDVIASTDNPISSGSIVSEPCNVWDTIWYDSDARNWQGTVTTSYSDNTRVLPFEDGANAYPVENNNQYFIPTTDDFIVEFDYIANTKCSIYFNTSAQSYNMGISAGFSWYNKPIKLVVKPTANETDVYVDGVFSETVANTRSFSSACGIIFRGTQSTASTDIGIKNLKIYKR